MSTSPSEPHDPSEDERRQESGAEIVRHEEELEVGVETHEYGAVSIDKRVHHEHVSDVVPRAVEHFDGVERTPPGEADSGEVEFLADGSISIPIIEEELVIEKRAVVRERIVIRKRTESRDERVDATLRKERVDVDLDDSA